MTLFFSGKTRCAICGRSIGERADAAQLSNVDPRLVPEFSTLAGSFVHRRCWDEWSEAGRLAEQAYQLVRTGSSRDPTVVAVFASERLVVLLVRATQVWLWQDFLLAVRVEIPVSRIAAVAKALMTDTSEVVQVGPADWHVRADANGVTVVLMRAREAVERFVVPADRLLLWQGVLQSHE